MDRLADHGVQDPAPSIERVDVAADGSLTLTVKCRDTLRWFVYAGGMGDADRDRNIELVEADPSGDTALVLAERALRPEVRVLAYRPGRRIVLRSRRNHAENGAETVVEKGYRRKRFLNALEHHEEAVRCCDRPGGFRTARLIEHDRERATLVFESMAGRPLEVKDAATDAWYAVGTALRSFQSGPTTLPLFSAADELEVLDQWHTRCLAATDTVPPEWETTAAGLASACSRLPAAMNATAHRDLHDGQLALTDAGPCLFDFDLLCRADVALDVANLCAHFGLRSLQGIREASAAGADACGRALRAGLGREAEAGFADRFRFYTAASYLRLALVYRLRPRWAHLASPLTELGAAALADMTGGGEIS